MEFRNLTPFPALAFQALDVSGAHHHVVAMRQTLNIQLDGSLAYAEQQELLAVEDEYFGDMNRSSVRQESDLAPFKPKCDVVVVATAYAPGGQPAKKFDVRVRIVREGTAGQCESVLDKTLVVTGPRYWEKSGPLHSWHLSEPEPITSLPVRYEYAYGGELRLENQAERERLATEGGDVEAVPPLHHSVVESNPVGRGYREDEYLEMSGVNRLPAPQIEDPLDRVSTFGGHHPAHGFGVITKAWLPRRQFAGSVDDGFVKSDRWLPQDFDFAFWNGAHPDLQTPYLQGNEVVELSNVTPSGKLRAQLPGHRPYLLVRYEDGEIEPVLMNLDTLIVDTEAMHLGMVFRFSLPTQRDVRVLEARFITKQEWDAGVAAVRPEPDDVSQSLSPAAATT